ncbi:hypothetical protein [Dryocola clanedunensis]|uniref:hypothetical protein n=1 Tax=Cedecea sulfonylureivorans TaxID=3051154 RepID=UPI001929093C|nr:hypothetical protein [Cedecea sulfonylureivorans]
MAGIHLHPHDILDEGVGPILKRIGKMKTVKDLFIEVNTIFERNPYPVGSLPHNPKNSFIQGTGTLHVKINAQSQRLYQRIDPTIDQGNDPLKILKDATEGSTWRVIPWANILNGDFGGTVAENQVIDFNGDPIEHWLCPNGPDVIEFWKMTFRAIKEQYGYSTFLIDRIRYPDWAGKNVRPGGLFTCFCPHCQREMEQTGISVAAVRGKLATLAALLNKGCFDETVDALLKDPLLQRWLAFRQNSVSRFVQRLLAEIDEMSDGKTELWLDLWPPAYAWILGQDYSALTQCSSTLKHFPYHKLGGGADVQGLIEYFAHDPQQHERAFTAFKRLFNLPYALSYRQFKANGFPIAFVQQQNNLVRKQSQPGTFIYSGIQMWNIAPAPLLEAVEAAEQSDCDDLLYYCYGWAEEELFDSMSRHGR